MSEKSNVDGVLKFKINPSIKYMQFFQSVWKIILTGITVSER